MNAWSVGVFSRSPVNYFLVIPGVLSHFLLLLLTHWFLLIDVKESNSKTSQQVFVGGASNLFFCFLLISTSAESFLPFVGIVFFIFSEEEVILGLYSIIHLYSKRIFLKLFQQILIEL